MRLLEHSNVVKLKHNFFSTTEKDELYLNLVLEYVPETVYRVSKHYSRMNQQMPVIYVQLYTYQVNLAKLVWHFHYSIVGCKILSIFILVDLDLAFFLDLSRTKLLASCCWGVSSWYQATEFTGKIFFLFCVYSPWVYWILDLWIFLFNICMTIIVCQWLCCLTQKLIYSSYDPFDIVALMSTFLHSVQYCRSIPRPTS